MCSDLSDTDLFDPHGGAVVAFKHYENELQPGRNATQLCPTKTPPTTSTGTDVLSVQVDGKMQLQEKWLQTPHR